MFRKMSDWDEKTQEEIEDYFDNMFTYSDDEEKQRLEDEEEV
jgi:hypothetical protein